AQHVTRPSARSWRGCRLKDRDVDPLSPADVIALDIGASFVAQPDRLGAERKCALLMHFDKGETAGAAQEEICGTVGIGQTGVGSGKERQTWLLIAGAGGDRILAARIVQNVGE